MSDEKKKKDLTDSDLTKVKEEQSDDNASAKVVAKEVARQKETPEDKEERLKQEAKEAEKMLAKEMEEKEEKKVKKTPARFLKKSSVKRQVVRGKVFIKSSYNNTRVTFTDIHGKVLAWSSAGLLGYKGAKKATTYVANQVVNEVHEKAQRFGLKDLQVYVKGVGSGRDAALRALVQKGYNLLLIKDRTPIPHNGCRPKKARRV